MLIRIRRIMLCSSNRKLMLILIYSISILVLFKFFWYSPFSINKTQIINTYDELNGFNLKYKTVNKSINSNDPLNSDIYCHSSIEKYKNEDDKSKNNNKKNLHETCTDDDWILIDKNGLITYNYDYLNKNNIIIKECSYQTIEWYKDDFNYKISDSIRIKNGSIININKDFFHFKCSQTGNSKSYHSAHARIFK